jgi:integrase/recombinase XerD
MKDKALEGLAERTLKDYEVHMRYFTKFVDSIPRSNSDRFSISMQILKDYLYHMVQEKELKPCTVNIRLRTLKCFLKWLYDNKHINENYGLKLKLQRVPEDTIKPLSDSDIRKMLAVLNRGTYTGLRDFALMVIILDCGIRIKELCSIGIDDIDLKERVLLIKGDNAKTRKRRELPLSKQSCLLLKELIDIAKEYNCKYVFNSSLTGEKLDENVAIKNFDKYGKKAGVKARCTPHVFRHTFATNAVKAGMDTFTLQRMLGHSSLLTTRKYIQLDNTDLKRNHEKMNFVASYLK